MTDQTTESITPAVDPQAFRNTLGRFATGVTVVTTIHEGDVHGMTASAFLSVSLTPPLVLVSVDRRAHLHGLLQVESRYGVSILNENQADYSQHFAGFGAEDLEPAFVWQNGLPLIEDALGHIVARVTAIQEAGDHSLFVAEVEHLAWFDGMPLLYFRGQYGAFTQQP